MTIDNFEIFIVKPKASVNLVTNPSVEIDTTGFSSVSSSIARDTTKVRRGIASLKVTPTSTSTAGVYFGTVTLSAGANVFSVDVWGALGIDYKIYFANTSGTLLGTAVQFTGIGDWQRIEVSYTAGTTSVRLYVTKDNETSTASFWIDGLLCEEGSEATTYFDGDSEGFTPDEIDYWWDGLPNQSISFRSAFTKSGGELIPISDYCKRIGVFGLGMPPIQNVNIPLTDGTERYLRSNMRSRYFTIQVAFTDLTVGTIDSKRLELQRLVDPNTGRENEPTLLKFIGYDSSGKIDSKILNAKCTYVSGLDQNPQTNKPYVTDITFKMNDPFLESESDTSIYLDNASSYGSNNAHIVSKDGEYLVVPMFSSVFQIYRIKEDLRTKKIWLLGNWTIAIGGVTTNYIAVFVGMNSSPQFVKPITGTSPNNACRDILFWTDTRVLVVGDFTQFNGASTSYCVWLDSDGATEYNNSGVGEALKYCVIDPEDDSYAYAAGTYFYQVRTTISNKDTSLVGSDIRVMKVSPDGDIYLYCHSNNKIYKGHYGSWTEFATVAGTSPEVYDFEWNEQGALYVVGVFTSIGGVSIDNFARYKDGIWTEFATSTDLTPVAYGLSKYGQDLIITGSFTNLNGIRNITNVALIPNQGEIYSLKGLRTSAGSSLQRSMLDSKGRVWFYHAFVSMTYLHVGYLGDIENEGDTVNPVLYYGGYGGLSYLRNNTTRQAVQLNLLYNRPYTNSWLDFRDGKKEYRTDWSGVRNDNILSGSDLDFKLVHGTNSIYVWSDTTHSVVPVFIFKERFHNLDGWLL